MRAMLKQKWLPAAAAMLVVAALLAYRMYTQKNPDVVQVKPHFIITAAALIEAFERDGKAADKQYANKVLQVSGTVTSLDASGAVVLGSNVKPSVVVAGFDQQHAASMQKIRPGDQVVLQGLYSGYDAGGTNAADLLAALGTTIQLRSAGLKAPR